MRKKLFCMILAWAMALSLLPAGALTARAEEAGACLHHIHDESCGYVPGQAAVDCDHICTEESGCIRKACLHASHEGCTIQTPAVSGVPCDHVHSLGTCGYAEAVADERCTDTDGDGETNHAEGCLCKAAEGTCSHTCDDGTCNFVPEQPAQCDHVCTLESGCLTKACIHVSHEGCAYREAAAETPCSYVCPVCPVQARIDALPEADAVTAENQDAVAGQLAAIDEAKKALTDEQQAQLNTERYDAVAAAVNALNSQPKEDPAPVLRADGNLNIADGSIVISATGYAIGGGAEIPYTGAYTVTGSSNQNNITVTGGNPHITLSGVNINMASIYQTSAINLDAAAGCTLSLAEGTTNNLRAGNDRPGIFVPSGNLVTIHGAGTLNVYGGASWPGIGRNANANVKIESGTVNAYGGSNGAGIGGSWGFDGGNVAITGGIVTAVGNNSNDIGGGAQNGFNRGSVTLDGNAEVHAESFASNTNFTKGIVINNGGVSVYGNATLLRDLTVGAGKKLTVSGSPALTVPNGVTLTLPKGSVPTVNDSGNLVLPAGSTVVNGSVTTVVTEGAAALRSDGTVDGSGAAIQETTKDSAGAVVKTVTTALDGSSVTEEKLADGSALVTEKRADGTVTVTEKNADGKVTETTVTDLDGSSVKTEYKPDGSSVVTDFDKSGSVTQTVTTVKNPDGTSTETQTDSKGNVSVTKIDAGGTPTEKIAYLNGGSGAYQKYTYQSGNWVKIQPKLIEGDGSTYNGKDNLVFRSDDAFVNFVDVKIDGRILSREHYSAASGSILVTLRQEYLKTLSHGTHTVSILSTNGEANGRFTLPHDYQVKSNSAQHWKECACGDKVKLERHRFGNWKVIEAATQSKQGTRERACTDCGYVQTGKISRLTNVPGTGDNNPVFLWIGIMAASAAAIGVIALLYRRANRKLRRKK